MVIEGIIHDEALEFSIGIGKVAQQKHQLQIGDEVRGESMPVADARREPVDFYRTSKVMVIHRSDGTLPPR